MFRSMMSMLSADLGLDLGSSRTRLYVAREGVVVDVPSVVAVRTRRSGRREVVAVGEDALPMVGRTPDGTEAVRPIRAGRIAEYDVADALLRHLAVRVHGRGSGLLRPRVVVAVTPDAPEMAHRAVRDSCEALGAREVRLVPKPLAAALGADLAVSTPAGHMVVDVGAGTTTAAVLCMDEVITSTTMEVAGDVFDGAIIRLLRREHALLVGQPTAERVKRTLGSLLEPDPTHTMVVRGRCLRHGVPRAVEVDAHQVGQALREPVAAIGAGLRRVLEQTPPEIASDVVDHGVILTGGASQLVDLDLALRADTGLAMLAADPPEHAVVLGVGRTVEDPQLLDDVAL